MAEPEPIKTITVQAREMVGNDNSDEHDALQDVLDMDIEELEGEVKDLETKKQKLASKQEKTKKKEGKYAEKMAKKQELMETVKSLKTENCQLKA